MILRTFEPSPLLQPYVRFYWECRVENEDLPLDQSMFPFGSFELIFNLLNPPRMIGTGRSGKDRSEPNAQPSSFCPGQFTTPFLLQYRKPSVCLGVSMHAWVGNLLFGIPACELTNRIIRLARMDSNTAHVFRKLQSRKNTVSVIEAFLRKKFLHSEIDSLVRSIVTAIQVQPSRNSVRSFLSQLHLTHRRIEQRFLAVTGLTMSRFIRKARFHRTIQHLNRNNKLSLTNVAHEMGYYDQPHFINEFKAFAGITPSEFIVRRTPMQNFFSSLVPVEDGTNFQLMD